MGTFSSPSERSDPSDRSGRSEPSEAEIPAAHAGRRLDKYLRSQLKGVPAGLIFKLLRGGKIRVNGRKVEGGYRIQEGDVLKMPPIVVEDKPQQAAPDHLVRQLNDAIVFEDEELLVLDKPSGLPVHVGTGHTGGVIEALRADRPHEPDLDLAHRIDADTSGLLVLTKTPAMLRYLSDLFASGEKVRRKYHAVVQGAWPGKLTECTAPLKRTATGMKVDAAGSEALTRFQVRKRFGGTATLVEAELITGRKHQIRVHTSHAGHPIAGDRKYGDAAFNRTLPSNELLLHATEVSFPLLDGRELTFTSPVPKRWRWR